MRLNNLIAARLKDLRAYYGFTQSQLAESMELPLSSVGKYERGETRITVDYIEKFCSATGHVPSVLFTTLGETPLTTTK